LKIHHPFLRSSIKGKKQTVLFPKTILEKRARKEVKPEPMNIFDDADVISSYPLAQAIEDGVLVEIFKSSWPELSNGKPIVATAHLFHAISLAGLMEIWNEFVQWQKTVMPTLPEAERLFHTTMNGKTVWVIADEAHIPSCIQKIISVSALCSSR
jgi:hypothetical protein